VLAESVGLALRRSLACPVEINLMPPELVKRKSLKKRVPFFALAAAAVLLSLGIWVMYEKQMAKLYAFQNEQVANKLSGVKAMQSGLSQAEKEKAAVKRKADAVSALMLERGAWLKRVDAVRKSLLDGMWLTELVPVKGADGAVAGVRVVGRGWSDKLKRIEEKARAAGRAATAIEELRDQLKAQRVFGDGPQDVRIIGQKDIGAYLIEFTIEARLAAAAAPKDANQR